MVSTLRNKILIICLLFQVALSSNGQVSDYGRHITDTLASDALRGRGYLGDGHYLAASFIKKEFARFGLKPLPSLAYSPKPYFQEFDLSVVQVEEPLFLKVNNKELVPGKDYIIDPTSIDAKGIDILNQLFERHKRSGNIVIVTSHQALPSAIVDVELALEYRF